VNAANILLGDLDFFATPSSHELLQNVNNLQSNIPEISINLVLNCFDYYLLSLQKMLETDYLVDSNHPMVLLYQEVQYLICQLVEYHFHVHTQLFEL
jgi:hypothetical protein